MRKVSLTRNELFKLLDVFFGEDPSRETIMDALNDYSEFPEAVWVFHYPAENKYYCVQTPGLPDMAEGLLCIATTGSAELAAAFVEAMDDELALGCVPKRIAMETLRQDAMTRKAVQAILLVDEKLQIRFVR